MTEVSAPFPSIPTLPSAPTRAGRKPRVWHLFVILVAAQGLGFLITSIAVAVIARSRGLLDDHSAPEQAKDVMMTLLRSPEPMLMSMAIMAYVGIALAVIVGLLSPRPFMARLRLGPGRLSGRELSVATLGGLALSNTVDALARHLPAYEASNLQVFNTLFRGGAVGLPYLILIIAVAAPLSEELLFRGAVQTRFGERFGTRLGLLLTSVCFAVVHFDYIHSAFALLMGLYLGWVCDLAASCRASFVVHACNNFAAVVSTVWAEPDGLLNSWSAVVIGVAVAVACTHWLLRRARRLTPTMDVADINAPGSVADSLPPDPAASA